MGKALEQRSYAQENKNKIVRHMSSFLHHAQRSFSTG
jgi:hypothetical protein